LNYTRNGAHSIEIRLKRKKPLSGLLRKCCWY